MHRLFRYALLPVTLFCSTLVAQSISPAPADLRKNLSEAVEAGTLESAGTPPFKLKATFETFDYLGQPDGTGTLTEEWFAPGTQRRTLTFRGNTWTETTHAGVSHQQGTGFQDSFMERRILDALFQPGPTQERLEKAAPTYRRIETGPTSLDCVVLPSIDISHASSDADRTPSSYCLSKNPTIIRAVGERYALILNYSKFLTFSHHVLPKEISIQQEGRLRASLHVTDFTPDSTLKEADFVVEPDSNTNADKATFLEPGVISGQILHKQSPEYSIVAKRQHISGSVILGVRIDKTGAIDHVEVIYTPDPLLVPTSLEAIKRWRYSPYLLNGQPVPVETTVTMNYSLSQ